jgi:hypothetical protein
LKWRQEQPNGLLKNFPDPIRAQTESEPISLFNRKASSLRESHEPIGPSPYYTSNLKLNEPIFSKKNNSLSLSKVWDQTDEKKDEKSLRVKNTYSPFKNYDGSPKRVNDLL